MQTILVLFALLAVAYGQGGASCSQYCDMLQTQAASICTSDFTIGAPTDAALALANCNYWCNVFKFPLGKFNDTVTDDTNVNTIGCRQHWLSQAIQAFNGTKDSHLGCKYSSITGGGQCGPYCDTYCTILENGNCTATFAIAKPGDAGYTPFVKQTCLDSCATYPVGPTDNGVATPANWGNSVQCRLYHAGIPAKSTSPGSGLAHCAHGSPHGGEACGDRCTGYCNLLVANCAGHLAPYASTVSGCLGACQGMLKYDSTTTSYPEALLDNVQTSYGPINAAGASVEGENSLSCRTYHASSPAKASAATHCPHASLEGAGVCGTLCDVYCALDFATCVSNATRDYTNIAGCTTACAAFATTDDFTATSGDTIHCRIYHLVVASQSAANADTHCPHAGKVPTSQCVNLTPTVPTAPPTAVPTATPTQPPTTTGTPTKAGASALHVLGYLLPIVMLIPFW